MGLLLLPRISLLFPFIRCLKLFPVSPIYIELRDKVSKREHINDNGGSIRESFFDGKFVIVWFCNSVNVLDM